MRQGVRSVALKNIWRDPKTGKTFYRSRRGGKLVLVDLPNLPHDHPDFIAAWAAARKGVEPAPVEAGSIASTWRAIMASPEAREWSRGYHGIMQRHSAAICAKGGKIKARAIRPEHIRADLDATGDPMARLKAWRTWGAWCVRRGIISTDPARAVRHKRKTGEGHAPWTDAHKAAFRARWPIGTATRALMELIAWTGARVSDAVRIGPQMVKGGVLEFRQQKTGDLAYVPWTCRLPAFAVRLEAERQMMHDAIAPFFGQLTFVPTRAGRPRSAASVSVMLQKACADLNIPVSAHGLRKTRAVELIEGGASPHDCAAWTGHQSLAEITHYAREFDRRRAVIGTAQEPELDVTVTRMDVSRASR
jgi:integrase/recombinase XerD